MDRLIFAAALIVLIAGPVLVDGWELAHTIAGVFVLGAIRVGLVLIDHFF